MSQYTQPLVSGALSAGISLMGDKSSGKHALKRGVAVAGVSLVMGKWVSPYVRATLPVDMNLDFLSINLSDSLLTGAGYLATTNMGLVSDGRSNMNQFLYVSGADFASRYFLNDYGTSPTYGLPKKNSKN